MASEQIQQSFEKAVAGLAVQGFRRSYAPRIGCMYRCQEGGVVYRCAVGHLIPPGKYSILLEGGAPDAVMELVGMQVDDEMSTFLCFLQQAHDASETPEKMRKKLRDVADRFSLACPEALND